MAKQGDQWDGGPYHPYQPLGSDGLPSCEAYSGISVRLEIASKVLAGLMSCHTYDATEEKAAQLALRLSDALLREYAKERTSAAHGDVGL